MGKRPKKSSSQKTGQPAELAQAPGGGKTEVLDESGAGGPFIPGGPNTPRGAAGEPPPRPAEEVVIEVVLTAPALATALAANPAAFTGGSATPGAPPSSALGAVLHRHGLSAARQVHTADRIREEEARIASLRQAAAAGNASAAQVSDLEQLPPLGNYVRLRFPAGVSASQITDELERLPEVARAVLVPRAMPPVLAFAEPIPSDPLIGNDIALLTADPETRLESQWYLHRTRVPQAWRFTRGADVVVADIDWGFRHTHQEFQPGFERTYNAVDGSADVTQGVHAGHGTAVMGIATARSDGRGMAGYAPEAARWAIQGDSAPGPQKFEEPWVEAIDFARRTDSGGRRKVIILEVQTASGGNYEQVPSVHRAIKAAIADGCVVCVAAGNGNKSADRSDSDRPFDPTGTILVGATAYDARHNKRASFSNFGGRVVVSAPGDPSHDLTCGQASDTAYRNGFGGTSGATPKVAGTVALMLSVNPGLTHDDVRAILMGTGASIEEDPGKPVGVFLNAEAAVAEALRRRGEAAPFQAQMTAERRPTNETSAGKALQGVRRRKSQLVLPQYAQGPISWDWLETSDTQLESMASISPAEQPAPGDKTLRVFRDTVEGTLTQQDRILIVGQAIEMLDNFYVHRTLKEAVHAVRPIQRLRVLLRRMPQGSDIPLSERDELKFHNTLTQIFNSVRDLHTSYQLPRPYRDFIAYLPFEVATFYENGERRYLVTRVVPGYAFADASFGPGAEILYWNGMTIDRAVMANADETAGSNDAARHARGVSALTIRPMNTALPPDADFVDLEFALRDADANDPAAKRQMHQQWFVRYAPATHDVAEAAAPSAAIVEPASTIAEPQGISIAGRSSVDFGRESTARSSRLLFDPNSLPRPAAPASSPASSSATTAAPPNIQLEAVLGLDSSADSVREARQLIFESAALRDLQRANIGDEVVGIRGSASPGSVEDTLTGTEINVRVPWNNAFRARTVDLNGSSYGHIHIRTFYVPDADGFAQEFVRLLEQIPETGLILDVRGNGGGNIWAAERLLQTMTARLIEPEHLQFVVSPGTLDLVRHNPAGSQIELDKWRPSIEEAVETAAVYSQAFPLTDPQSCNAIGQRYYGPVVLVVDGNCYSATDMFAAGFQDHKIGKVLGVSSNTGAGGANVWEHWLLNAVLPPNWGLKPLPNQASMRVAIRQCLRVGPRAGALLEDFGVIPNEVHLPTRADVLEGDKDLFAWAAGWLAKQLPRSINVIFGAIRDGQRQATIRTRGLKRLDFFVNDRPEASIDIHPDAQGEATITPLIEVGSTLRLAGYAELAGPEPAASQQVRVP